MTLTAAWMDTLVSLARMDICFAMVPPAEMALLGTSGCLGSMDKKAVLAAIYRVRSPLCF